MNARSPIEDPAPNPKQPFSRQNYDADFGGPIQKDHVWLFASSEHVHENASMFYFPASATQFDTLAALAAEGSSQASFPSECRARCPSPFATPWGCCDWTGRRCRERRGFCAPQAIHTPRITQWCRKGALPSTGLRPTITTSASRWAISFNSHPSWWGTSTSARQSLCRRTQMLRLSDS